MEGHFFHPFAHPPPSYAYNMPRRHRGAVDVQLTYVQYILQTLLHLRNSYFPEGPARSRILRKSESSIPVITYVCVQTRQSSWNSKSSTPELDRPQRDSHPPPPHCVIAQQYFSATFASLRFHSRKETYCARFKMSLFQYTFSPF